MSERPATPKSATDKVHRVSRPRQLRYSFFDFKNFSALLAHLAEHCEPWEVMITEGTTTAAPKDWLQILDDNALNSPYSERTASYKGDTWTIVRQGASEGVGPTFRFVWNLERHGWADSGQGEVTVHYFVPPSWLAESPKKGRPCLVSMCKRRYITNDSPIYPVHSSRAFCKKCCALHESWNAVIKA
jgi:hypothetical protein